MNLARTRTWQRLAPLAFLLLLPVCDRSTTEEPPPDLTPALCPDTLPAPPSGQRCTVTPSPTGSKSLLLTGTLLLPDSVQKNGQVLIDSTGKIACVSCDCTSHPEAASAAKVSCPDGVISPGLINSHDHITYTKAEPGTHPTNRYNHRHEWRIGVNGDPKRPKIPVAGNNNTSAIQWGELRQLMAGTTSLVGSGSAKGVLRNLDTTSAGARRVNPRLMAAPHPPPDRPRRQARAIAPSGKEPARPRADPARSRAAVLGHDALGAGCAQPLHPVQAQAHSGDDVLQRLARAHMHVHIARPHQRHPGGGARPLRQRVGRRRQCGFPRQVQRPVAARRRPGPRGCRRCARRRWSTPPGRC